MLGKRLPFLRFIHLLDNFPLSPQSFVMSWRRSVLFVFKGTIGVLRLLYFSFEDGRCVFVCWSNE